MQLSSVVIMSVSSHCRKSALMRVTYKLYWEHGIKCFGLPYGHLDKRGSSRRMRVIFARQASTHGYCHWRVVGLL